MRLCTQITALGLFSLAAWPAMAQPAVVFSGPTTVDEGRGFTVSVAVSDAEGAATWSWDLDGDGQYGEARGEASVEVPPGQTDGPEERVFDVEAVGPSATTRAERRVLVSNQPPTFASGPPTEAAVGQPYLYRLSARDAAGARDPLELLLTSRPEGMSLVGESIEWTPSPDQRGARAMVIVRVTDDDGGERAQSWEVEVAHNQAPPAPTPVSPIERLRVPDDVTLIASFGDDPDGDPLFARFRVARQVSFDDPEQRASPDVAVEEGEARWNLRGLSDGLWYWEVRAADADSSSAPTFGQFVVVSGVSDGGLDASVGDAGLAPGGGACSVTTSPASASAQLAFAAAAALALFRRRRKV